MSWKEILKEDLEYNNKLKSYADKLSKIKFEGIEDAERQGYKVLTQEYINSRRYIIVGKGGHTGTFSVNFQYEPIPEKDAKKAIEILERGSKVKYDKYGLSNTKDDVYYIKTHMSLSKYGGGTSIVIDDFINLNVSYTQYGDYIMPDKEKNKVKWF